MNYTPLNTTSDIANKIIDLSRPVGTIEASATVSNNGSSNYTIPIATPFTTNGLAPVIALVYSSHSGNGIAGYGWAISGISTISRNTKNMYYDNKVERVTLNSKDPLNLDGNRLVLLNGNYGEANSYYGYEMENYNSIQAVTAGGNDIWFRVKTKEGTNLEYGNSVTSRIVGSSGKTIFWKLNKITDNEGNYIEFIYANTNNESLISEINFTGNTNASLLPYNKIKFEYLQRKDKNKFFESGEEINFYEMLNKIIVTADGNVPFKTYQLFYAEDGMYSFLKEIEETGTDGTKLNTTIFKYGDKPDDLYIDQSNIVAGQSVKLSSGDYNGDGISDILFITQSYDPNSNQYYDINFKIFQKADINAPLVNVYTETLPQTSQIHRKVEYHTSYYSCNSTDFNGDGQDDIIMTNINLNVAGNKELTSVSLYYSDGGNNFLQSNYTPITLNGGYPTGTFNKINPTFNYFIPGDFDGDGKADFITILSNGIGFKIHYWKPSTGILGQEILDPSANNPYYSGYKLANMDKIYVSDFDGDGKQELMTISNNECKIYIIKPTPGAQTPFELESIYQAGYPTKWHNVYTADFNGDGKTDILTGVNGQWEVSLSTGTSFYSTSFTFNKTVDINNHKLILSDFNGDGKTDILHGYDYFINGVATTAKLALYYSTGISYYYELYNYPTVLSMGHSITVDLNGDGRYEFIDRGNYMYPFKIVHIKKDGTERLLEKVATGTKHITEFKYKSLSNSNNFYTKGTNVSIFNNLNAQYPLNNIQMPVYCVSKITVPDGIGGTGTTTYKYENAKLHRAGKGFLGFKKIITENSISDTKEITESEFNTTYYVPYLISKSDFLLNNNSPITLTSYTNQFIGINNNRFKCNLISTDEGNAVANTFVVTDNTFDIYGNIITQNKNINNIENTITNTQYGIYGTPVPAKPTLITISKTRQGANTISKTSSFAYNAMGQVTKQNDFVGLPDETTISYQYDIFGNITQTYTSYETAYNQYIYRSTSEYDAKGRFPIMLKKFALPQMPAETMTEYFNYDEKWGKPISHTSSDCQFTTYIYDGWGRLIQSTLPTSVQINTSYNWAIANGHITCTHTTHPARPSIKIYSDILGRTVKTETESYGNQWVIQNCSFNNKRNKISETNTYLATETPLVTSYVYDAYNRLISASNNLGTNTLTYQYNNGQLTTINTNPAGQTNKKTMDASGKIIMTEDDGGKLYFTYDSWGNKEEIKHGNQLLIKNTYGIYGRQTQLYDKNAGTIYYTYNGYGLLVAQTDANNNTYSMYYDGLQRLKSRYGPEGQTIYEYQYNNDGNCITVSNNLVKVTDFNSNKHEYFYDNYNRLISKKQTVGNVPYTTNYVYDSFGNLTKETKPFGLVLNYNYEMNTGLLKRVLTGNNDILFQAGSMNGLGQYKQYSLGNGTMINITYHYGIPIQYNAPGLQNLSLQYNYQSGNLISRTDAIANQSEHFTYDNLNRLTSTEVTGQNTVQYQYDGNATVTKGNIKNSDYLNGAYNYYVTKPHAVFTIDNPNSTVLPPENISTDLQEISYTPFQKISEIKENSYQQYFTYNADYQRLKSELSHNGTLQESKLYLDDCEVLTQNGNTKVIYYVAGGDGLCAIAVKENGQENYYFTFKDHLGSIVKVTDKMGNIVAEQNFDAWGRKRNPIDWTYSNIPPVPTWLYRGYTAHEDMPQFALINMNGRLYDPAIGRMLGPDNYVSNPYNTQGYNRYSYANNNPLIYTDPDGNMPIMIPIAIGVIAGAYSGGVMANGGEFNPAKWDDDRTLGYMAGGAIVGGISGAAGAAVAGLSIPFAGTAGIVISSTVNSMGMCMVTGGQSSLVVSFGIASFDFSSGEFGYIFKKGNKWYQNVGYGFGALANIQDFTVAISTGFDASKIGNANVNNYHNNKGHSPHSTIEGKNIDISVGGSLDLGPYNNRIDYVLKHLRYIKGEHSPNWINDHAGWTRTPMKINGLNTSMLRNMTKNLINGKGILGGTIKYGPWYGCQSHTMHALFANGIILVPFNFSPLTLQLQLFVRQFGIYSSPFLVK